MPKLKLSVIILTYNEENYIADAIRSVAFADEIIVLDSYSTDRTPEIVSAFNAKLIYRKFDNYSNQRNHAIQSASGE